MLELLLSTAGVNCAGLAAGLIGDLTVIRAGDGETFITGLMIFSNIGFSFSDTLSVTGGTTLISPEMDEPLVITCSTYLSLCAIASEETTSVRGMLCGPKCSEA